MPRQQEGLAPEYGQQGGEHGGGENLAELIRQLTHQGSHLAEQQLNCTRPRCANRPTR